MGDPENFLDGPFAPAPVGPSAPRSVTMRRAVTTVAVAALVAATVGYVAGAAGGNSPASPSATATSLADAPLTSPSPSPSFTPPATSPTPVTTTSGGEEQPADDYLALLETIPVKGRAPMTGYDREYYYGEPWMDVDGNGCRTREDILRRDLTDTTIRSGTDGCVVETGVLDDPYTGQVIDFQRGPDTSALVQIDHVVALADSWQKGAQQWSQGKREAFANDPRNLLAVDGEANQQKGAGDAATWLPPNRGYWCDYAARIAVVKAEYGVWT